MKHMRLMFCVSIALLFLLAACVPASTPTPIIVIVTATTVPGTATPPAATEASTSAPPTAAPVDLAGPPMQVGSTYLYFDGALLVAVPGGPFTMGHGGFDNPEHTVTLSDFWIYSTKVTNREFQQCVAVGKCTAPNLTDNQGYNDFARQSDPIVGVDWSQGEAYCEYANGRLPTEAQWEKTARGPNANVYPWGNGAPSSDLLNYNNIIGRTTNVINYPKGKSYYDALDMEGNVYEWVADWYGPLYYKTGPAQDPLGPDAGESRSVRSAGYRSNNDQVPASTRFFKLPTDHARDLGFRCVVKDPTFFAPMCSLTASAGPNLSGGTGSAAGPDCPTVGVSVGYAGCGNNVYAVVTFTDDHPGDSNVSVSAGSCTWSNSPNWPAKYVCTNIPASGIDVSIDSFCTWPSLPSFSCPAHYNLVGNACQWDGSGTAGANCPAGTTYDPINKCCTTTPGTGTNYPACPAGSFIVHSGPGSYWCWNGKPTTVNPGSATVSPQSIPCGGSSTTGTNCVPSPTHGCP